MTMHPQSSLFNPKKSQQGPVPIKIMINCPPNVRCALQFAGLSLIHRQLDFYQKASPLPHCQQGSHSPGQSRFISFSLQSRVTMTIAIFLTIKMSGTCLPQPRCCEARHDGHLFWEMGGEESKSRSVVYSAVPCQV